jgi:hypothetical protein
MEAYPRLLDGCWLCYGLKYNPMKKREGVSSPNNKRRVQCTPGDGPITRNIYGVVVCFFKVPALINALHFQQKTRVSEGIGESFILATGTSRGARKFLGPV